MGKLSGKTALVTGAARGLGRAYALRLASLGANVGIIDLNLYSYKLFEAEAEQMTADNIVDEIKAMGVNAFGVEADTGNQEQVFTAVQEIASKLGDIMILVTNAGGGLGGFQDSKASQMDLNLFRKVVERNFYGTVYTVNATAPMMKKNRAGKIVTVSSQAGTHSNTDGSYAHYGPAKAAIEMYTKYLAQELGLYGINVNCIAPGYIVTGRLKAGFDAAGHEKYLRNIALGRFGTPEDCAKVIEFLTTDLSDYVTGAVIDVSGGTTNKIVL